MKNLQGWMILGIACLAGCVGTTIPVQAQQTATAIVVKERLVEQRRCRPKSARYVESQ